MGWHEALPLAVDDPSLEQVAVGRSLCLYQPVTQAVALLEGVLDGVSGCALPGREALAAAGLLGGAQVAPPGQASVERPGSGGGNFIGTFGAGCGAVIRLWCCDAWLGTRLSALLAPLRAGCSGPEAQVALDLVVGTDGAGGYDFALDGVRLASGVDRALARRLALNIVLVETLRHLGVGAILHGAAVARGGRAVVLAGATGAGKSTLSLGLAAEGWRHLGDDLVPLSRSGRAVHGFPVAASVKSGSWGLLEACYPALGDAAEFTFGERRVKYVETGPAGPWSGPVAGVIVCRRETGHGVVEVAPLSPEAALSVLLRTGSEAVGNPPSMRPLASLVNETPVVELAYETLGDGVAAVGRLAQSWMEP